jgi:hypothetical protein
VPPIFIATHLPIPLVRNGPWAVSSFPGRDQDPRCQAGAASVMPYVFVSCVTPRPFARTL